MKTFFLTATYLVGTGELLLAIFFLKTNHGQAIRRVMVVLTGMTGVWVILSAASSYTEASWAGLAVNGIHMAGVLLLTALVHLAILFPYPIVRFDRLHTILLYTPGILLSAIGFTGKGIVYNYHVDLFTAGIVYGGDAYFIYNCYLLILFITAITLLGFKFSRLEGNTKNLVGYVFFSVIISAIVPIGLDVLFPLFLDHTVDSGLYGVLSSVVWLGVTTYVVVKK